MFKSSTVNKLKVIAIGFTWQSMANGALVEVGDLNIIDDAGNASNGLRFLDMTYSDGKSLTDALTDAQAVYSNARLATAAEVNDLFNAVAYPFYSGEDIFTIYAGGSGYEILSGPNAAGVQLITKLGKTRTLTGLGDYLYWYTDDVTDYQGVLIFDGALQSDWRALSSAPDPEAARGFMLVSEASVVPIPAAAWLFGSALFGLVGVAKRKTT